MNVSSSVLTTLIQKLDKDTTEMKSYKVLSLLIVQTHQTILTKFILRYLKDSDTMIYRKLSLTNKNGPQY